MCNILRNVIKYPDRNVYGNRIPSRGKFVWYFSVTYSNELTTRAPPLHKSNINQWARGGVQYKVWIGTAHNLYYRAG